MFKERKDAKIEISAIAEPVIFVLPLALEKMGYYVGNCSKEIGWLGTVEKYGNNFLITDTFLFKQEVHATTCEITPEGLSDFATELLSKENGVDIWNNIKLWGHSHVRMGVSPSGQDNDQMKVFGEHNEYFIRVIANKNGEMEFTIFDFITGISYKNVKWCEYRVETEGLEEQIKKEIKDKVTEKSYTVGVCSSRTNHYGYGYGWGYDDDYYYKGDDKKKEKTETKVINITNGDKPIEWDEKTILTYFDDEDLKEISKLSLNAQDQLDYIYEHIIMYGIDDDISVEDSCKIINIAENKYPI